jgi:hypothetical protein
MRAIEMCSFNQVGHCRRKLGVDSQPGRKIAVERNPISSRNMLRMLTEEALQEEGRHRLALLLLEFKGERRENWLLLNEKRSWNRDGGIPPRQAKMINAGYQDQAAASLHGWQQWLSAEGVFLLNRCVRVISSLKIRRR